MRQGRMIKNHRVQHNGRAAMHSACRIPNVTPEQLAACTRRATARRNEQRHARLAKKLNEAAPPSGPFTGYMVFGQWDGKTVPDVEWALQITRQSTEFSFDPKVMEMQYQNVIPNRKGPINVPSYTSWDALARNFFLASDNNDRNTASLWGINIAPSTNTSTPIYPKVPTPIALGSGRVILALVVACCYYFDHSLSLQTPLAVAD